MFNSLILSLILLLSLCLSNIQVSYCAKQAGVARKEDIPFIKCQVCEKLAKELYLQVIDKQDKIHPKKVYFNMCTLLISVYLILVLV